MQKDINGKIKFSKEELIFDMPYYAIYMIIGEGWYVANKITKKLQKFEFATYSYLDVINYADSIV